MRGVLRRINKPLTFSFSTLPPCKKLSSFVKGHWEFSARNCDASQRLKDSRLSLWYDPRYAIYDSEFCIKHLNTGITFSFNAYDALYKSDEERRYGDPLKYSSYASPLNRLINRQCDSAYVGNILIEKPGEQAKNINPTWELIDWKTLDQQFHWVAENEQISTVPTKYTHFDGDEPTFFVTNRKEGKKTNGLVSPLVNLEMPLYVDFNVQEGDGVQEDQKSSCNFSLVVTNWGWFVRLYQIFNSYFGGIRERIMTMHSRFWQNIIYREIIELQSQHFEDTVPKFKTVPKLNRYDEWGNLRSYVEFHEAKQLKIQEPVFMNYWGDHDAPKYSSFTVTEWKEASLHELNVSVNKIKSLYGTPSYREPGKALDSNLLKGELCQTLYCEHSIKGNETFHRILSDKFQIF